MSQVPPPPSSGRTSMGVAPNVGGMLAYAPCCIGLFFSIAAFVMEKQNRFVRFCAIQSLLLHAAFFAVALVLFVVQLVFSQVAGVLGFLVTMLMGILGLAFLALLVLLMLKANQLEEFELPFVGEIARKQV